MRRRFALIGSIAATLATLILFTYSNSISQQSAKKADPTLIKRGEMLVTIGGCNDCHSPKVFTQMGPLPDSSRLLSGHPSSLKLPELPVNIIGPDKWGAVTNNDLTAWYGPWGVSFAANLTPDNITGIGAWTEDSFIKAMRSGKHLGAGRAILPPMPWFNIGQLPNSDLKAIFAYLRSLKPIENEVPMPIPPTGKG